MTTRITVPVDGMSCTGCENNIQFALTSLRGVGTVDADHKAKTVQVDYDPEAVTAATLRQAIQDMGYEVATQ
jgi:copper chaperone